MNADEYVIRLGDNSLYKPFENLLDPMMKLMEGLNLNDWCEEDFKNGTLCDVLPLIKNKESVLLELNGLDKTADAVQSLEERVVSLLGPVMVGGGKS